VYSEKYATQFADFIFLGTIGNIRALEVSEASMKSVGRKWKGVYTKYKKIE
jgi:hypothetical protein